MINFQEYLESIKELGNYEGDFVQARAALDKHEEQTASLTDIINWIRGGILDIMRNLMMFFRKIEFDHPAERITDTVYLLQNIEDQDTRRNDSHKAMSMAVANITREINRVVSELRQAYEHIPPRYVEEFRQLRDIFFKILKSHVRSAGTREVVRRLADPVAILVAKADRLADIWIARRCQLRQHINIDDLHLIPQAQRTCFALGILSYYLSGLAVYYSNTDDASDMEGPSPKQERESLIWHLRHFASHRIARPATPAMIMNVVDQIVDAIQ